MLEFLKFAALIGVAAAFALAAIKRRATERGRTETFISIPIVTAGVLVFIAALIGVSSFGTLGAGERGVVLRFGGVTGRVLTPGLYGVMPIIEGVHSMNVQVQKETAKAAAVSKDMQQVTTEVALNYSLAPESVAKVFASIGDSYRERIIDPAIQEAVKATTAKYTATELVTARHTVKEVLMQELTDRLGTHGILVDGVSLTDFAFTAEYMKAIEEKVTATQQAMKAENDLKTVQFEAQQRVEQARAEAEAIRIQAQAIQSQGGREYVTLKAIEKWDGSVPQWVMGGSNGQSPIPFIQITPPQAAK